MITHLVITNRAICVLTLCSALIGGALVANDPLLPIPVAAVILLLFLSALGRGVASLFMGALATLLVGFLFQSKAFAYYGLPPIFISEIVLSLGIFSILFCRIRVRLTPVHFLLFSFIFWGTARTVPFVRTYGMDAVRDAAQWYYALFAIITSALLTRERIQKFLKLYSSLLPTLLVWLALSPLVASILLTLPHFPGSPFPILYVMKPGDRGVILAGLAAFLATGLYSRFKGYSTAWTSFLWTCWTIAAVLVSIKGRGGMLSIALSMSIVWLIRPSKEWLRPIFIGMTLLTFAVMLNPTVDLGGNRQVSVGQLTTNIVSIFSNDTQNTGGVQGTKEWRIQWWTEIFNDTVRGPYFLAGQGFGINLADEYGFAVDRDGSLRSPHNSHVTILARMGVPGIVIWIGLHCLFFREMLGGYRRARRLNLIWSEVVVWLLAMWGAALVNASFDVYLESPYGAIPLFCCMGAGLAVLQIIHEEELDGLKH